jgi:hypothetical protein
MKRAEMAKKKKKKAECNKKNSRPMVTKRDFEPKELEDLSRFILI